MKREFSGIDWFDPGCFGPACGTRQDLTLTFPRGLQLIFPRIGRILSRRTCSDSDHRSGEGPPAEPNRACRRHNRAVCGAAVALDRHKRKRRRMSEIDSYRHECIGIVRCPSSHELVHGNDRHRLIPIYRLDENILDRQWGAKRGDLLLGGGSGESAVLRISVPEAFTILTNDADGNVDVNPDCVHAFWTSGEAFVFCEGYRKLGWTPAVAIERWLAEHLLAFVLREYPDEYRRFAGKRALSCDGSICRRPTAKEAEGLME